MMSHMCQMVFLLSSMCSIIRLCNGYRQFHGYISTYSTTYFTRTSDEFLCLEYCIINQFPNNFYMFGVSWFISGLDCWCNHVAFNSIATGTNYRSIIIWRPPVNTIENELEIGSSYKLAVNMFQYVGGNDKFEIFVLKNVTDDKTFGGLIIHSWKNEPSNNQNKDNDARQIGTNYLTKQSDSIHETFPTVANMPSMIQLQYEIDVTVNDMGMKDGDNLNIVSVLESNAMIVIDVLMRSVFRRTLKNCKPSTVNVNEKAVNDRDYQIQLELETNVVTCNTDLENIIITIITEENLEYYDNESDPSCIDPTEIDSKNGRTVAKFSRLFISSKICLILKFKKSSVLIPHGTKPITLIADLLYTEFADGAASKQYKKYTFKTFVSKGVKGFFLRNKDTGACVGNYNNEMTMKVGGVCDQFRLGQHNLVHGTGKCFSYNKTLSKTRLENCERKKRTSVSQLTIKFKSVEQYYAGVSALSKTDSTQFERFYTGHFGLGNDTMSGDYYSDLISLVAINDDIIFCSNSSKNYKEVACLRYSTLDSSVRLFPQLLHSIVGYDVYKHIAFAHDKNGRRMVFFTKSKEKPAYVSDRSWDKMQNENVSVAVRISRNALVDMTEENVLKVKGVNYSVTYFGLFDTSLKEHVIIMAPTYDCHKTVGQTNVTALNSCKEIKSYCKTAKSGVYWIGGSAMTSTVQVYCDMETGGGGWVMMSKNVVTNGYYSHSESVAYCSKIEDLVKFNFTKILAPNGYTLYNTYMPFNQMRFYCYSDSSRRTIHLETLLTDAGQLPLKTFRGETTTLQTACNTFFVYPDDNSLTSRECERWVGSSSTVNRWGTKVHKDAIKITSAPAREFNFAEIAGIACDDFGMSSKIKNAVWKIFVR